MLSAGKLRWECNSSDSFSDMSFQWRSANETNLQCVFSFVAGLTLRYRLYFVLEPVPYPTKTKRQKNLIIQVAANRMSIYTLFISFFTVDFKKWCLFLYPAAWKQKDIVQNLPRFRHNSADMTSMPPTVWYHIRAIPVKNIFRLP